MKSTTSWCDPLPESVVMLTPEPPYPLRGGGAFRIASLLHYFSRFAEVDLIYLSDSGKPAELPPGLVRNQIVIPLPVHSRGILARYSRNAWRALRGVPPLFDRVSGLEAQLDDALRGRHYDFGVAEHFWVAGYVPQLFKHCDQVILDLHNIESTLHSRSAATSRGLVAMGHRRFAEDSRRLEAKFLPLCSLVLATSEHDRREAQQLAPASNIAVFPNSYPFELRPEIQPVPNTVVFSGNFEYHPNIDGVQFLMEEIWPRIVEIQPNAQLRLVGRGSEFVRDLVQSTRNVSMTGPVEDAIAEIARGAVVIAPLRTGSGTRVKVLEAWAAGRPVVATHIAAEGLDINDGVDITLEAEPRGFAAAVCRLLANEAERTRLARGGQHTLSAKYTWKAAWKTLDDIPQVSRNRQLSSYTG